MNWLLKPIWQGGDDVMYQILQELFLYLPKCVEHYSYHLLFGITFVLKNLVFSICEVVKNFRLFILAKILFLMF